MLLILPTYLDGNSVPELKALKQHGSHYGCGHTNRGGFSDSVLALAMFQDSECNDTLGRCSRFS